jgi:hypothetical protein
VVDSAVPLYGPMQAFYFASAIGDAACAEAPESGILIQTPADADGVTLAINDTEITLGSTAFLQAERDGFMYVNLIEGTAFARNRFGFAFAPQGTRLRVELDDELHAVGAPQGPEPYDNDVMEPLPISLLERDIDIAPSLSAGQIDALSTELTPTATLTPTPSLTPTAFVRTGNWTTVSTVIRDTCGNAVGGTFAVYMTFDANDVLTGLTWNGNYFAMFPNMDGYIGSITISTTTYTISLRFTSSVSFTAEVSVGFTATITAGCTTYYSWQGTYP